MPEEGSAEKVLFDEAISQAIDMIKSWEVACDVSFPGDAWSGSDMKNGPISPADELKELKDNNSICIDKLPTSDKTELAWTSPSQALVDASKWNPPGSISPSKTCMTGGPGINMNGGAMPKQATQGGAPATHPAPKVGGAAGETYDAPTFETGGFMKLVATLIHESHHAYRDGQNLPGNHDETRKATAEFLCAVLDCAAPGLTDDQKAALCSEIRTENKFTCKEGVTAPVECEACDDFGGTGSPCPPEQPPGGSGPGEVVPKTDIHRVRFAAGTVWLQPGARTVTYDLVDDGTAFTGECDLSNLGSPFQPLSIARLGRQRLLISGYDISTYEAVFAQIDFEVQQPRFFTATEIFRTNQCAAPTSLVRVVGTPVFYFMDSPTGRLVEYNFRDSSLYVLADLTNNPNYSDYGNVRYSRSIQPGSNLTQFTITKRNPGHLTVTPLDAILLFDVDGDGEIDFF